MIEYQISFTRGTRVGTRSTRTVVINADDLDAAIPLARVAFKKEYPDERGYRLTSAWSSEEGLVEL